MLLRYLFVITLAPLAQVIMPTAAASTECSSPIGPGTAGPNDPFWLEKISHQVSKFVLQYSIELILTNLCRALHLSIQTPALTKSSGM